MNCGCYSLLLILALVARIVDCSEDIEPEDIYQRLFEPSEKDPIPPQRTLELLKQAQAHFSGKSLTDTEKSKFDLINSYVEAGVVRADKCNSNEFKKLNLMIITGLYKLDDNEHFGMNDLPSLLNDDFHYTNALDFLKAFRRRQVKECAKYLEQSGFTAVERINANVRKELTDTTKDFVDSLYRIAKTLILSKLKSESGLKEYGQIFRREIGDSCSTISAEIKPLLTLRDILISEAKKGEIKVSEYFNSWVDRAKTCEGILERIEEIIEGSYDVYANDKSGSGKSFLGKMMSKCFGKKSCRKAN